MKIKYKLKDMPLYKQSQCIGDLTKYFGESKYKLIESVEKIEENRGLSVKLLNTIRKHTHAGMTIDGFVNGLSLASGTDIFKFKINGSDITKLFKDGDIELEIYMNPLYFVTKGAMFAQVPGFRRKTFTSQTELELKAKQEQTKWLKWFEKELNKYHPRSEWNRQVISND